MSESCCCGTSKKAKTVDIEYLYLDLNTCERCVGTDKVLEGVLDELRSAFSLAGYSLEYHKVKIETAEMAHAYRFLSSPTIRVNGRDICNSVQENNCGCCGEIAGTQVDCRVFSYNGETYEVPPAEMIAEAIMRMAFRPKVSSCCSGGYALPENLKNFFDGKEKKCCDGGCSCGCC